jgi:cellulose 1,4-beta-cellobiosidase
MRHFLLCAVLACGVRAAPPTAVDTLTTGNPFAGATMYRDPAYARQVDASIARSPADAPLLEKVKAFPTAVWVASIAKVAEVDGHLDEALAQQEREGKPVVSVFVVYDLPDRDCHANASHGELRSADGGLDRYRRAFIDPLAAAFRAHPDQRIVVVVEPDSLPNLATNLDDPRCVAAAPAYREGVAYAIRTLAAPNVSLYLDAGHAGWLGWPDNQKRTARVFKEVLDAAGGPGLIRGFASNVANYTVLQEGPERYDYQSNPCRDERTFQARFSETLRAEGIPNVAWIVDTSRNGRGNVRSAWGAWCNTKGAGLGARPVADPAPGIDAYYWVKPPGESDGTTDPTAPRYDPDCSSPDASPGAPEAGKWFHPYFLDLVRSANPPR